MAFPGPLGHVVASTRAARAALGMPDVPWAAEYEELEALIRRHPAYAAYLLRRIAPSSRRCGPYGGWAIVGPTSNP